MLDKLQYLITIPTAEAEIFTNTIKEYRKKYINSPSNIVTIIFDREKQLITDICNNHNISEIIISLREKIYTEFLTEESIFNIKIIKEIGRTLETPKQIIKALIENKINQQLSKKELTSHIQDICGEYAGRISPYIYQLSLSNT